MTISHTMRTHTYIYELGIVLGFNQNETKLLFQDEMGYFIQKGFIYSTSNTHFK